MHVFLNVFRKFCLRIEEAYLFKIQTKSLILFAILIEKSVTIGGDMTTLHLGIPISPKLMRPVTFPFRCLGFVVFNPLNYPVLARQFETGSLSLSLSNLHFIFLVSNLFYQVLNILRCHRSRFSLTLRFVIVGNDERTCFNIELLVYHNCSIFVH